MDIDADNKGNILLEYLLKANFAKFFKSLSGSAITRNKLPVLVINFQVSHLSEERKGRGFRKLKKKNQTWANLHANIFASTQTWE